MPAVYRQSQVPNESHGKRHDNRRTYRGVTSEAAQRLCKVCGQEAAGIYFSALVCLPCKSFFLRCANGKEPNVKCEKKNCKINAATRTICKFCRYKRCLAIGMTRKELPEKADAVNGQELCRVCGDVANGVHFGAVTCEGCKNFFRRSLSEGTVLCKKGGNCVVNLKTRKGCRGCRYKKCIAAGMSKEAKKPGRRNRPIEIFTNEVNIGTVISPVEVTKSRVISEELFHPYQESMEEMETTADFMGQAYPFDQLGHDAHDFVPEFRQEVCSSTSSHGCPEADAFNLIDDIVNGNFSHDNINSVQNVPHDSLWNGNNSIVADSQAESFITLETVQNISNPVEGATMETLSLTQEGAHSEDFTMSSTSSLSSPTWSPTPSQDGSLTPLSPHNVSKVVIASLDGECPVQIPDNCHNFSSSFSDMSETGRTNFDTISSNSLEYENNLTDFDNTSFTLNDALNDVMELLTEELDLTPIVNCATSANTCEPQLTDSGYISVEPETTNLDNRFGFWFSENQGNKLELNGDGLRA